MEIREWGLMEESKGNSEPVFSPVIPIQSLKNLPCILLFSLYPLRGAHPPQKHYLCLNFSKKKQGKNLLILISGHSLEFLNCRFLHFCKIWGISSQMSFRRWIHKLYLKISLWKENHNHHHNKVYWICTSFPRSFISTMFVLINNLWNR